MLNYSYNRSCILSVFCKACSVLEYSKDSNLLFYSYLTKRVSIYLDSNETIQANVWNNKGV